MRESESQHLLGVEPRAPSSSSQEYWQSKQRVLIHLPVTANLSVPLCNMTILYSEAVVLKGLPMHPVCHCYTVVVYAGRVLKPSQTLGYYQVTNGCTIHVLRKKKMKGNLFAWPVAYSCALVSCPNLTLLQGVGFGDTSLNHWACRSEKCSICKCKITDWFDNLITSLWAEILDPPCSNTM